MQLTVHGSHNLIARELLDTDTDSLQEFCTECGNLGWVNNKDFKAIKLDTMQLPYGKFFVAVDGTKVVSLAGVHKFPEVNDNAYRCLFRGAQLPTYTPKFSMNMFASGIHFTYFLYQQINLIRSIDSNAEFYITTNIDTATGGESSRINRVVMPRQARLGIWELYQPEAMIYHTLQNVWKINVESYLTQREAWIKSQAS